MLILNKKLLEARIYHGLKSLQTDDDVLQPRYLEIAICEAFGFKHVGDSTFYADGTKDNLQLSIKTRKLNPEIKKRIAGRDFQTNPNKFLGPQVNKKQKRWTNGLEIVQRRQKLEFKNDSTAPADKVGIATLNGFQENVKESYKKYNTDTSYEVIGVHGYNKSSNRYIVSLFWKEYEMLNSEDITWIREGSGVSGYVDTDNDGIKKKVCTRVNGNAKREATCFKEYKNLTKYQNFANINLPIPEPWEFDLNSILAEIDLKEPQNASILFEERHCDLQC